MKTRVRAAGNPNLRWEERITISSWKMTDSLLFTILQFHRLILGCLSIYRYQGGPYNTYTCTWEQNRDFKHFFSCNTAFHLNWQELYHHQSKTWNNVFSLPLVNNLFKWWKFSLAIPPLDLQSGFFFMKKILLEFHSLTKKGVEPHSLAFIENYDKMLIFQPIGVGARDIIKVRQKE